MIDPIETFRDIAFDEPGGPRPSPDTVEGGMTPSSWPETMGRVPELWVVVCRQEGSHHLLKELIGPGGDATSILPPHPNRLRDSSPSPIRITLSAVSASRSFACAAGLIP